MSELAAPRFASVVLDVDSTLCGVEGIDWLARRGGAAVAAEIARLTERAMDGAVALEAVYGERLAIVRPTVHDVTALALEYRRTLAPGAREAVVALGAAGVRVVLVSGGLRDAIVPLARTLGLADHDVHAVPLRFDADGAYAGFDERSPLTTDRGKRAIVAALALPRPTLMAGDGATDAAARPAVDAFAAFTGFVRREPVVKAADMALGSFAELRALVLGG
ncbi:MAG TPA: HAD-IB family phosphatase [Gemmatimonadaceae bacterium]|nr:HAD-IB family phosphatase [Gemmatimonadaceae bacterium]